MAWQIEPNRIDTNPNARARITQRSTKPTLRPCPTCGQTVAKSAQTCPHCGAPQPSTRATILAFANLLQAAALAYLVYWLLKLAGWF